MERNTRKAKVVGIREAVEYLAYNDDACLGDEHSGYTTGVMMIAHLFDREPCEIAQMIERKRATISAFASD